MSELILRRRSSPPDTPDDGGAMWIDIADIHLKITLQGGITFDLMDVVQPRLITLLFGTTFNSLGFFALANGIATDNDSATTEKTRQPVAPGTISRLLYHSASADVTTVMRIHIDGAIVDTFNLPDADGQVFLSIPVLSSGYVELEWESGTAPGQSTWAVILEID